MLTDIQPLQAFVAGAFLVAAVAVLVVAGQRRRLAATEAERRRLEAVAVKAREMLAAAPDGLMLWDHVNGGFTCSRRLAVLLGLEKGIQSRYGDIRGRFEGDSLKALEQAVSLLRANGTPFDLLLEAGRRRIQAVGARAEADGEGVLADLVWMRDVTTLATGAAAPGARMAGANTSGLDDRHLTALLDAMPMPVWLRDSRLGLAFVNRAGRDLAPPDTGLAQRARAEGRPVSERRAMNGGGNGAGERVLEMTETPLGVLGGGGESATGGTLGFAIDAAQRTSAAGDGGPAAAEAVLETIAEGVAIFDDSQRLRFFNAAYAGLWGLERDWLETRPEFGQVLEKLRETRRLPEVADFRQFKMEQLARFETLSGSEDELLHLPDGRTIKSVSARHGRGGLAFVFEDVSERLDLERSVKALGQVQHETIDNLHEGIAVFGSDGRLKLSNPVFAGLWEIPADDLTPAFHVSDFVDRMRGRVPVQGGWDDLSWGVHRDRVLARLMGRDSATGQIELADGTVVDYANVPLPDGAMLLSYQDVTDSYRVEKALRQRAEALTEADRLKSKFIADVSYEVRTPLNTIIGFADMLKREFFGKLNRRQGEYAAGILDSSRGLLSMVNDILDLASIEAGQMELARDSVDIHGLLVAVMTLIEERAKRKAIKLEFDCPPTIGWITGDERRLKQVVFNLLGNAVTFTPDRGTVRLESRREGDDLLLVVSDTGIGIPVADRDRVFRPFERGPQRRGDDGGPGGGAGLGLSLVRNFVELHGGSVDVKSPPGRGTTVTCRIPAAGPKTEKTPGDGAAAG